MLDAARRRLALDEGDPCLAAPVKGVVSRDCPGRGRANCAASAECTAVDACDERRDRVPDERPFDPSSTTPACRDGAYVPRSPAIDAALPVAPPEAVASASWIADDTCMAMRGVLDRLAGGPTESISVGDWELPRGRLALGEPVVSTGPVASAVDLSGSGASAD